MRTDTSVWRALADPTRRRLIELLRDGPRTTGELCRAFPTSRFAVMKHLGVLERGGLLSVAREGRNRWNSLNPELLRQVEGRWGGGPSSVGRPGPAETTAVSRVQVEGDETMGQGVVPAARQATLTEFFVDAVPWKVFDALTVNVAAWWGAPHLRRPDASNLVLESQPGGRFFEEWGHRQGALRATVSAIRQDERVELRGPLFDESADSRLCFHLEAREGGTIVRLTAECVSAGTIDDLFRTRLKAFAESGTRSGLA